MNIILCENRFGEINNYLESVIEMKSLCGYVSGDQSTFQCEIEIGSFLPLSVSENKTKDTPKKLNIVEYNIDRNGYGKDGPNENGIEPLIETLKFLGEPDILILSEVARNCPKLGDINGAEEIARALQMEWAYSVEFQDLDVKTKECTIGNAILSKRPLSQIEQKSFISQCCMFSDRQGARQAIKATIEAYNIVVVSAHLESGTGSSDFLNATIVREKQAKELVNWIKSDENTHRLILIGGDFNNPFLQFKNDQAFKNFFDPFLSKYPYPLRRTSLGGSLEQLGLNVFDYMFFKNDEMYHFESYICSTKPCYGVSDHFPLQVKLIAK